jgi:hypothetical protein
MFRLFLAAAAAISSSVALASPQLLPSFDALMTALKSGSVVKGVYTYSKCTIRNEDPNSTEPPSPAPNAIGGNTFQTWEYFAPMMMKNPNGFVSTSESVLITHRKYGYIYNYGRTKVLDDGRVELLIEYLDVKTMEVKMHEIIDCRISNGADSNGAAFYAN